MLLESYSNPLGWFMVFCCGSIIPKLRGLAGGSWKVLFLAPLVVRLFAQLNYQRNASIQTARYYYENRKKQKSV
jgi:hypothetical protein|eukprot:COSAG02_NODE_3546_length_6583_cov_2.799661_7_plen_74_part_00